MIRVGFMQRYDVGMLFLAETVAIQAQVIVHFACLVNLSFVTRIFTACFIGNKFGMVNCDQTAFDDLVGHLVAIRAARLDHTAVGPAALEKVAGIACIFVNGEVLVSFEVAVAGSACNFYPMNVFIDVIFVGEFDAGIVDIRRDKLCGTMALGPQAGSVPDRGVWFCADPADYAVYRLGQPVNLAFYITGKTRLQVTVKAVDVRVAGTFPTVIIVIHDVAGIAKARLPCNNNCPGGKKGCA